MILDPSLLIWWLIRRLLSSWWSRTTSCFTVLISACSWSVLVTCVQPQCVLCRLGVCCCRWRRSQQVDGGSLPELQHCLFQTPPAGRKDTSQEQCTQRTDNTQPTSILQKKKKKITPSLSENSPPRCSCIWRCTWEVVLQEWVRFCHCH